MLRSIVDGPILQDSAQDISEDMKSVDGRNPAFTKLRLVVYLIIYRGFMHPMVSGLRISGCHQLFQICSGQAQSCYSHPEHDRHAEGPENKRRRLRPATGPFPPIFVWRMDATSRGLVSC